MVTKGKKTKEFMAEEIAKAYHSEIPMPAVRERFIAKTTKNIVDQNHLQRIQEAYDDFIFKGANKEAAKFAVYRLLW